MDTEKVYNKNASKWLRLAPSSLSDYTARPYVFKACGKLNGRSVLDIGCGEGYCARKLKRLGAGDYLGIDMSAKMIEVAKSQEATDLLGIEYRVCNVVEFVPERQFDICIAVFLFNYLRVSEMRHVFSMIYETLPTQGRFIFCVPHPSFTFINTKKSPPFYFDSTGKNYFSDVDQQFEGEIWKRNGESLHVQYVHKKFSDYFECLKTSGFSHIPEVEELTVTPELVETDRKFFSPLLNKPLHVLFNVVK